MTDRPSASSLVEKPFMGVPLSVGLLMGNIGCWGLYLENLPNSAPSPSKLVVFGFLAAASLFTWSYRESYYEDRVVVRYLPFVKREVRWTDVQRFSASPILKLFAVERTLSLPGTTPFLQSFLKAHLHNTEDGGFADQSPRGLLGMQLGHSSVWGAMFILSVVATAPFLAGGPLHRWWDSGGTILILCDFQLLVAVAVAFGQTALYVFGPGTGSLP